KTMKHKQCNPWIRMTLMRCRSALLLSLIVCTLLFAAPVVSQADIVVFNNFGAGLSYNTTAGNPIGNAFDGNNYAQGDVFTSTLTGAFNKLQLALSCSFACPDSFVVSLDANRGGQPGTTLESFLVTGTSLGPLGANNVPMVIGSVLHPLLSA